MSDSNPAGWQPDPTGRHDHRYWDGTQWTDNVSNAGVASTDPFTEAATPAVDPTVADAPAPPPPVTPADTTAAWSTTPGAPVPPVPQGVAGGGADGSKKGLLVGGGILVVVALLVIAFLALSKDDDESPYRADLVSALSNEDQGGLSTQDAECVADAVIDNVDSDVLKNVDFNSTDIPPELTSAYVDAVSSCNVDIFGNTDSESTTTTEGTDEETTTTEGSTDLGVTDSSSLPDNFEEILADTYENSLGLDRDKAECLAGKLADAIEAGTLNEDEAASAIFDYLADCDISLDEIGAN